MFTIDMDYDLIEIVLVSENVTSEDLKLEIFDDIVYFKQWDENKKEYNTIMIDHDMWEELVQAIGSPEGAYIYRKRDKV